MKYTNLLGETSNTISTPIVNLVYRKPHKSVNEIFSNVKGLYDKQSRKYDFKDFISISPTRIVKYSRNMAPDTTDYTDSWIAKGAVLLPDGTLDKSNLITSITEDNRTHGIVSEKGNKNINLAIDWMVLLANNKTTFNPKFNTNYTWKMNFITLTLSASQVHSDKEIMNNILQPFLDYLRKSYKIKNYFWRAETQANGNLHFHLCLDVFIPWMLLRNKWNKYQNNLGYIDRFEIKCNHRQPNSTDIHSLKNIKKIGAYLAKYCGKNTKGITIICTKSIHTSLKLPNVHSLSAWNFPPKKVLFFRQVHCKLWSCSQAISKLKKCRVSLSELLEFELTKIKNSKLSRVILHDYATTIMIEVTEFRKLGCNALRDILWKHIFSILEPLGQET